jgi:RNA polymerase sigma-70 factor (ECF subfamily)
MGQVVAFKRDEVVKKAAVRESSSPLSSLTREVDWAVLLRRIVNGDQSAVAELYDGTNTLVFGLAFRILGERAAAEDVVVEVYTQVWKQAQTYDAQRGTPLTWLLTVTRSRAIDALRARQRLRNTEPLETATNARADAPDPEEVSSLVERRRVVCHALDSLSAEQRQVIELAYFSDLSHTEIAEKLGQPLGTIKTRIRTGLLRLREVLGSLAPFTAVVS